MTRLNLPSGATADLRPVEDVTERQRRPIKRIQAALAGNRAFAEAVSEAQRSGGRDLTQDAQLRIAAGMGDAFDQLEELNDRLIVAFVRGWSYGFDVNVDNVQDIPSRDLDALREAVSPLMQKLMPDFEPTPEADSPTGPSIA